MKNWLSAGVLALLLTACTRVTRYDEVVKISPPAEYVGNWQTFGPQRGLVSPDATASLIIDAQGNTLDCRQWQRVIAKAGRVTHAGGELVNVNQQLRVMPLVLKDGELHYDQLKMRQVARPTPECWQALKYRTEPPPVIPAVAPSTEQNFPPQQAETTLMNRR